MIEKQEYLRNPQWNRYGIKDNKYNTQHIHVNMSIKRIQSENRKGEKETCREYMTGFRVDLSIDWLGY